MIRGQQARRWSINMAMQTRKKSEDKKLCSWIGSEEDKTVSTMYIYLIPLKLLRYGIKLGVLDGKHFQSCFVTSSESDRPDSS